jgi:hypothetical protein
MRGVNQRDDAGLTRRELDQVDRQLLIDGKDIVSFLGSSDSLDRPDFAPAFLTC